MILVDSSVWVDHLRSSDSILTRMLTAGQVLAHPFIIGELALGNLRQRKTVLGALRDLPQAVVASDDEVLLFIDQHALAGLGIGYIDAHLLASVRLSAGALLWTRDKRLREAAARVGVIADPNH